MSHCPGPYLEDFITDWHMLVDEDGLHGTGIRRMYEGQLILSKEQFTELVRIYEPCREEIERKLQDYSEEDNGSWRDYSYYAFQYLPEEVTKKADAYCRALQDSVKKTPGIMGFHLDDPKGKEK